MSGAVSDSVIILYNNSKSEFYSFQKYIISCVANARYLVSVLSEIVN